MVSHSYQRRAAEFDGTAKESSHERHAQRMGRRRMTTKTGTASMTEQSRRVDRANVDATISLKHALQLERQAKTPPIGRSKLKKIRDCADPMLLR
mmetsp:Transcript_43154/g.101409  ORF Transcript_43154/g.101409 Transcript_43154/m.101409 type:complete len:95 (+) Transcript_43154:95-379(+)